MTGKKPFIQKLTDRIVVNVDNSVVNAGSTALEVLERSPGVTINQNDQIALRGKQGVIIMVDGKVSPPTNSNTVRFGADFFPSKKTIIGFVVNTNFN